MLHLCLVCPRPVLSPQRMYSSSKTPHVASLLEDMSISLIFNFPGFYLSRTRDNWTPGLQLALNLCGSEVSISRRTQPVQHRPKASQSEDLCGVKGTRVSSSAPL